MLVGLQWILNVIGDVDDIKTDALTSDLKVPVCTGSWTPNEIIDWLT